jgi:hypothetical protein
MRAECAIPLRNFLGSGKGIDIARSCGQMRIAWVWGACAVICAGLFIAHYQTKKNQEKYEQNINDTPSIVVPLWLCFLPIAFAVYTALTALDTAEQYWATEQLNFETTGMNKEAFLNYRIPDDRLITSTGSSLIGTSGIVGAAILGPWARADNR